MTFPTGSRPQRAATSLASSGIRGQPAGISSRARIPPSLTAVTTVEVRRRTGRVKVSLGVLDLTSAQVLDHLGVTEDDLVGDSYGLSQDIAIAAERAGFEGILAPSAALPGRQTLVVFHRALGSVDPEHSAIRQPPPRVADLLHMIRPHPDVPLSVRHRFAALAAAGSEAIRRLRRRSQ